MKEDWLRASIKEMQEYLKYWIAAGRVTEEVQTVSISNWFYTYEAYEPSTYADTPLEEMCLKCYPELKKKMKRVTPLEEYDCHNYKV